MSKREEEYKENSTDQSEEEEEDERDGPERGPVSFRKERHNKRAKSLLSESLLSETFRKLSLQSASKRTILDEPTYDCFIQCFKENCFKKVITIVGAGISTAAGVPDFRSPDTGLYENLAKYNLPYPQAIFEIDYFEKEPSAFYDLAKQLIPGNFKPTISHYFIRILEIKGLLIRHYTQNVDGLERKAGISDEKLVEAHGSFSSSHCMKCNKTYSFEWLKQEMQAAGVPTCVLCNTVIKPDIVFFGESLPNKFFECISNDFPEADLLIIMGSSLLVEPFASLVKRVNRNCPRIIINDQEVGHKVGILYDPRRNKRDIFIRGTCDDSCMRIINSMDWNDDLEDLLKQNS